MALILSGVGTMRMKSFLYTFCVVIAGVIMAPAFLVHSRPVEKVDCAIMLVGGENDVRFKGAEQLVAEVKASALLVPAHHRVLYNDKKESRSFSETQRIAAQAVPLGGRRLRLFGKSWRIFENTHLELLTGRRMMEKLGYRSAVIVSSPYHMRRLQLIAHKVFGDDFRIGFAATPFEAYDVIGCYSSWNNFRNVASEYAKIGWFLVYSWFV